MRVDLHNHTKLCNHASGEMHEYVERAIEVGIDIFGFSCHAPMDYDKEYRMSLDEMEWYEKRILELRERYIDKIEILIGYEVDFLEGYMEERVLNADVDYLIGSVHFLNGFGVDNPESIFEYTKRDINDIWFGYFLALENMVKSGKFDIVGHLDLVKIFNYYPTKDIRFVLERTLKAIKDSNMSIEINASGLRKQIKEQYPSKAILEMAYSFDIPITFGSDAHAIEHIGYKRDYLEELAKSVGYSECVYYKKRDMIRVKF